MKRICATLLFALLLGAAVAPPSNAQTPAWKHQIVFNSGPQLLTGDFADAYKTGLAIDVGYYYRATDALFVGVYGGYHQFKDKSGQSLDIGNSSSNLNIVPVNLAFKYNFSLSGVQPYIGAEGGPFFLSPSEGDGSTEIGVAPRIGLRIPLSRGIDLDLNVKYNVIFNDQSNFTYVGANGGFAYIMDRANIQYR
jgi:outer membrane protein W